MSRSGYSDDCDGWALIRWRGAVTSAIRGRRGQAFLRELAAALDALPEKKLISGQLEQPETGEVCALGSVARRRGINMRPEDDGLDPEDNETLAKTFNIAEALVKEIAYLNDEEWRDWGHKDEKKGANARWHYMRRWVELHLKPKHPWLPPGVIEEIYADVICGVQIEGYDYGPNAENDFGLSYHDMFP